MAISFMCPACGAELVLSAARPGHSATCTSCGAGITVPADARQLTPGEARKAIGRQAPMDDEEYPPEILSCRFNFGAFLMTPIWLLLHRRYLAGGLLILLHAVTNIVGGMVPLLGLLRAALSIAASVYFGIKGYRIAWRDRGYYDAVEDVRRRERRWAILGIVIAAVFWTIQILVAV